MPTVVIRGNKFVDRAKFVRIQRVEVCVKCWVYRELTRESDGSLSEGTEGIWLQLVRSCALCLLCDSRFQRRVSRSAESQRDSEVDIRKGKGNCRIGILKGKLKRN